METEEGELGADGAAVLDCGNQLCIWLGAELPDSTSAGAEPLSPPGLQQWDRESVRAACYDLAARLSASRFPVPPIRCVSQVRTHLVSLRSFSFPPLMFLLHFFIFYFKSFYFIIVFIIF